MAAHYERGSLPRKGRPGTWAVCLRRSGLGGSRHGMDPEKRDTYPTRWIASPGPSVATQTTIRHGNER